MHPITTEHLILHSLSPESITSLANGTEIIAEGIHLHPELQEHNNAFKHDLTQLKADPAFQHWSTRAVLLKSTGEMIGIFRFHTLPNPDYLSNYGTSLVEIGYAIFTPYRRKGFAEEMIREMISWAKPQAVQGIITSIAPNNAASTKLVTKLGFMKIGEALDEVDGIEHIYMLKI